MKLTYWYAQHLTDSDCYSIVAKTKREALRLREERDPADYGRVVKRVINYADAFDLLEYATSEGGGRGCGLGDDSDE
jgi:hypothetical protein